MKTTNPLAASRYRISSDDLLFNSHPQNYIYQTLPEEAGTGQTAIYQLDQDLSFIETHYLPSKDLAVFNKFENQEPRLVLTLGLKGNSRFKSYQGDEFIFDEGYTTITTFGSSKGERQYEANKSVTQLRISVTKSWLERYFGEQKSEMILSKMGTHLLSHRPTSCQAIMASRQLLASQVSQAIRPLYRHGQAMTILASELAPLFEDKTKKPLCLTKKDRNTAEMARAILAEEFRNPPSLAELSRRVGTNVHKLKALFHYFFNSTPYCMVSEFRMIRAYQLLESRQFHVNRVADLVGFNHASNFTTAFSKYYGVSPKALFREQYHEIG